MWCRMSEGAPTVSADRGALQGVRQDCAVGTCVVGCSCPAPAPPKLTRGRAPVELTAVCLAVHTEWRAASAGRSCAAGGCQRSRGTTGSVAFGSRLSRQGSTPKGSGRGRSRR